MPANVYESLIMLDTAKMAGDLPAAQQQLHAIMEKHHAEVLASRPWDERRLSYPIRGQKKALYYLLYFKTGSENLVAIEHDLKMNETVLRVMVLRVEEKLVDTMLALARDEHALALQSVVEEPDDFGDMGGGRRGGDRGDRRGGGDRHGGERHGGGDRGAPAADLAGAEAGKD
jgi:small subunit ribosomal protein S6